MNKDRRVKHASIFLLKISSVLVLSLFLTEKLVAGAWTLKKRQLLFKTSLLYQKTNDRYYSKNTPCTIGHECEKGQRIPFPFNGESKVTGLYFDLNSRKLEDQILTFSAEGEVTDFPFMFKDDQTGSSWNLLGEAVGGPLTGNKLEQTLSYNAYWFAWGAFYMDVDIYVDGD